jgi:phospholipase A1
MKRRGLQWARIGLSACALLAAAATAQTNLAPVSPTVAQEQPQVPDATTPAQKAEVPLTPERSAPVTVPDAPLTQTAPIVPTNQVLPQTEVIELSKQNRGPLQADPDAYSIVSAGSGLSLHKPMFVLPYTYSEEYHGQDTEAYFQISLKQRLFSLPLYLGYTQKAFWQFLNDKRSSPFRETDYNPELFYRYIPADREKWHHLGADFGFEHESNGRDLPDSRSWNRFYFAPFVAEGDHAIYLKLWYRLPENKGRAPTDPDRDDNPDIQSYYGYGELNYIQQIFNKQVINTTARWNPTTGRGSIRAEYTIPSADNDYFFMFYLFQGYGEDLLNYNHSVFRLGVGLAVAR